MVWVERTDAKGRVYYANKETGESSWSRPPELGPSPEKAVDGGGPAAAAASWWVERVDQRTGRTYYANKKTREVSWVKPPELAAAESGGGVGYDSGDDDDDNDDDDDDDLPGFPGFAWEERKDKRGRRYYVNKSSGESSWSKPDAPYRPLDEDEDGDDTGGGAGGGGLDHSSVAASARRRASRQAIRKYRAKRQGQGGGGLAGGEPPLSTVAEEQPAGSPTFDGGRSGGGGGGSSTRTHGGLGRIRVESYHEEDDQMLDAEMSARAKDIDKSEWGAGRGNRSGGGGGGTGGGAAAGEEEDAEMTMMHNPFIHHNPLQQDEEEQRSRGPAASSSSSSSLASASAADAKPATAAEQRRQGLRVGALSGFASKGIGKVGGKKLGKGRGRGRQPRKAAIKAADAVAAGEPSLDAGRLKLRLNSANEPVWDEAAPSFAQLAQRIASSDPQAAGGEGGDFDDGGEDGSPRRLRGTPKANPLRSPPNGARSSSSSSSSSPSYSAGASARPKSAQRRKVSRGRALDMYAAFVEGIVADGDLQQGELDRADKYRSKQGITKEQSDTILKDLGYDALILTHLTFPGHPPKQQSPAAKAIAAYSQSLEAAQTLAAQQAEEQNQAGGAAAGGPGAGAAGAGGAAGGGGGGAGPAPPAITAGSVPAPVPTASLGSVLGARKNMLASIKLGVQLKKPTGPRRVSRKPGDKFVRVGSMGGLGKILARRMYMVDEQDEALEETDDEEEEDVEDWV
eukprot:g5424.t1